MDALFKLREMGLFYEIDLIEDLVWFTFQLVFYISLQW